MSGPVPEPELPERDLHSRPGVRDRSQDEPFAVSGAIKGSQFRRDKRVPAAASERRKHTTAAPAERMVQVSLEGTRVYFLPEPSQRMGHPPAPSVGTGAVEAGVCLLSGLTDSMTR